MLLAHLHDVVILALEPESFAGSAGAQPLTAHEIGDSAGIAAAYVAVAHRIAEERIQRRLCNGLRFVRFDIGDVPVATTWIAGAYGRYIDELNWLLPIGADELWLRDVFVAPACRGRGVFASMVAALSGLNRNPLQRIWSDVDWVNKVSMRVHLAAGFEVVARARALDFGGRLRLRSARPAWPLPITEIHAESRWIWLSGERLRRHQQLVA